MTNGSNETPSAGVLPAAEDSAVVAERLKQVQAARGQLEEQEKILKAQLRAHYRNEGKFKAGEREVILSPNNRLNQEKFTTDYPYNTDNQHMYEVKPKPAVAKAVLGDELYAKYLEPQGELKVQVK